MATVSAPRSGSRIDVRSLVDQLVEAKSRPTTTRLDAREAKFGARFLAIKKLKSALSTFGVSIGGLNNDTNGLSALAFAPNGSGTANLDVVDAAVDARVLIEGQLLTSQTNSIDFAIEGVTLNLLEVNEDSPTTFSVAKDSDVAIGSIKASSKAITLCDQRLVI
jgi:flagellar capping protein FliD